MSGRRFGVFTSSLRRASLGGDSRAGGIGNRKGRVMSYDFVVTIEGARQGRLADDPAPVDPTQGRGRILGLSYSHQVESDPRDPGPGATTRPLHTPVVFSKRWGPASPQLFSALTAQELLTVRFEFNDPARRRPSASGLADHTTIMVVVLTDAQISGIRYASTEGSEELEFVSLRYRSLRIESPSGASATGEWMA
jgi:type VI protein secretion system component Hcp